MNKEKQAQGKKKSLKSTTLSTKLPDRSSAPLTNYLCQLNDLTVQDKNGGIEELSMQEARDLIQKLHVNQAILEKQNKELRTAQKENAESLDKYSDLFNCAPVGYFTLDKEGLILDVNLTGADQLGAEKKVLIRKPFSRFLHKDDQDNYYLYRREVLERKTRRACEVRLTRSDKSEFNAQLVSIAQYDSEGTFCNMRTAIMNVTERKQGEKKLSRHRKHLMELVSDRTSELQKINEQLQKEISERKRAEEESIRTSHLASLGELAAGVAHEINNPINGIINYTQILANKITPRTREHEIAMRIIKEGDRIAGIVNNLLSFAREIKEQKKPVNIRDIMSDSLALTETQLKKDGIRLIIHFSSDLPTITAQPQQIEQVFLNIISNARYALNQKYPTANRDKLLEIRCETVGFDHNPYVKIVFHDHGCGMPAEIRDKIINPFFTTKPTGIGTGLGLSISHGIITDHGGSIRVDSTQGEFTKVVIELPSNGIKKKP
jgi:PAS domain S-box-containing protein